MKNNFSFTKVKTMKRLMVLPMCGCVRVYVMWEEFSNKLRIVVKCFSSWQYPSHDAILSKMYYNYTEKLLLVWWNTMYFPQFQKIFRAECQKTKVHVLCIGAHLLDGYNVPSKCRSSSRYRMNTYSRVRFHLPSKKPRKNAEILQIVCITEFR